MQKDILTILGDQIVDLDLAVDGVIYTRVSAWKVYRAGSGPVDLLAIPTSHMQKIISKLRP